VNGSLMLLDPVRDPCAFTLNCDDLCPCWAPSDYTVVEPDGVTVPACLEHVNRLRDELEAKPLQGYVIRTRKETYQHGGSNDDRA
jgi:hypothetical protein